MRTVRLRYRVEVVDWSPAYPEYYEGSWIYTDKERAESHVKALGGFPFCTATLTEEEY